MAILLVGVGGIGYWRTHWYTRTSGVVLTLIPPFPFLSCDPGLTPGGSGVLVDPVQIDEQIRKAWLPLFCRGTRGNADLDAFRRGSHWTYAL